MLSVPERLVSRASYDYIHLPASPLFLPASIFPIRVHIFHDSAEPFYIGSISGGNYNIGAAYVIAFLFSRYQNTEVSSYFTPLAAHLFYLEIFSNPRLHYGRPRCKHMLQEH